MLTLGVVSDVHFGPEARFDGKLRKLTARSPELLEGVVGELRDRHRVDLLVNLGDCIEDESPAADAERYRACLQVLEQGGMERVHVAGNHDRIHLGDADLRQAWGMPAAGPLYRSFDRGGH
ncbi:MAG: metallophosphoesterase, partial [Myxococcales bacterium]|nr:metallophosphoesterase [Myxococcales bacterium]